MEEDGFILVSRKKKLFRNNNYTKHKRNDKSKDNQQYKQSQFNTNHQHSTFTYKKQSSPSLLVEKQQQQNDVSLNETQDQDYEHLKRLIEKRSDLLVSSPFHDKILDAIEEVMNPITNQYQTNTSMEEEATASHTTLNEGVNNNQNTNIDGPKIFTEPLGTNKSKDEDDGIENDILMDIVCYGIGSFSHSLISQYQMVLLLSMIKRFPKSNTYIYDPVLSNSDKKFIKENNIELIEHNELGLRKTIRPTLFYMPHCPESLYNNVLSSNFNFQRLSQIAIVGNSFEAYIHYKTVKELNEKAPLIPILYPLLKEDPIENWKMNPNIFNNTSIHSFKLYGSPLLNEYDDTTDNANAVGSNDPFKENRNNESECNERRDWFQMMMLKHTKINLSSRQEEEEDQDGSIVMMKENLFQSKSDELIL